MIIKNYKTLASNHEKKRVLQILEAGLSAAIPDAPLKNVIRRNRIVLGKNVIRLSKYERIFVIGIGKAADSMANIVSKLTDLDGGIIVMPKHMHSVLKNKKFEIIYASHPIPNSQSVLAAKKILQFLKKRKNTDFIIFLISGGSSSLVALPDGITLNDKKIITNLLLKSGANIHEINCVRKHLSKIKGGKMIEHLVCDAISLIISDVIGDDPSDIASGLTYCDKTTFSDARNILQKYSLIKFAPKNVLKKINLGVEKKLTETPKSAKIKNHIISTNKNCLHAMAKKAKGLGLKTKIVYPINGNVQYAAKKLVNALPKQSQSCIIFGGETTVKVTGIGKGGRNQELVLYALREIQQIPQKITVASLGTDGEDGNTDACGAIAGESEFRLNDITKFLQNNNSYHFFKKHNGLIFTGPTHTNLMDVGVMLR